jgi:hypothetical protein
MGGDDKEPDEDDDDDDDSDDEGPSEVRDPNMPALPDRNISAYCMRYAQENGAYLRAPCSN